MTNNVVPIGGLKKKLCDSIDQVIKYLTENRDSIKSLVIVLGDGKEFMLWLGPDTESVSYATDFAKGVLTNAILSEYGL
jgi:hypothetical protein